MRRDTTHHNNNNNYTDSKYAARNIVEYNIKELNIECNKR